MELCDKTLEDVIKELTNDSILKSTESLTTIGYYIASQIFIQMLKGVNHLHKQNPSLIHRDLKPANVLLQKKLLYRILCQNCRFWTNCYSRLSRKVAYFR